MKVLAEFIIFLLLILNGVWAAGSNQIIIGILFTINAVMFAFKQSNEVKL